MAVPNGLPASLRAPELRAVLAGRFMASSDFLVLGDLQADEARHCSLYVCSPDGDWLLET
jgi:hypothetical protein